MQVVTDRDIRNSIRRARKSLEEAAREIVWQTEVKAWIQLDYPSWTAMREAEYGAAAFMVPSKSHPGWPAVIATPEPDAHETDAVTATCNGCDQPMTGRADRRYCSSACRQRAYRQRVTA